MKTMPMHAAYSEPVILQLYLKFIQQCVLFAPQCEISKINIKLSMPHCRLYVEIIRESNKKIAIINYNNYLHRGHWLNTKIIIIERYYTYFTR